MVRIVLVPLAALLLLSMMAIEPAMADDVDVALVLVTDVSRSIDDSEFKLEKDGYTSAFTSQKVLEAIHGGPTGRIAVAYLEFASSFEVRTVLDWTVIQDKASAQVFVDRLAAAPRSFWGRTAISAGIDQAMQLLAETGMNPTRRVIDVCGDGTNNAGRDHDQRIGDYQRPPGVLDVRACPAARRPGKLLSGKCDRRARQLRAGSARFFDLRRGNDPKVGG
jgi:hypothetical protein